jgi:hypothetical protein
MRKKEKIKFLKIAISCLREEGDNRLIFSPSVPTEEDIKTINISIKNEEVNEELLKKFFPMAYEGITKHNIFEYFFFAHNSIIRKLERYTEDKLFDWCTAYPAKIISKENSKWLVENVDGKRIITDSECYPNIICETNLKKGDKVILHREKISLVLNNEDFEKAVYYYNKFKGVK